MFRRLSEADRDAINRKVDGWMAKFVGAVLLWIGVVFAGLTMWAIYKVSLLPQPEYIARYAIAAGFSLIGIFGFSVGWRLFWNKPNRYGSVLGPIGWGLLCLLFAACGIFIVVALGASRLLAESSLAWSVFACCVFSYWCFHLARRAIAHASKAAL